MRNENAAVLPDAVHAREFSAKRMKGIYLGGAILFLACVGFVLAMVLKVATPQTGERIGDLVSCFGVEKPNPLWSSLSSLLHLQIIRPDCAGSAGCHLRNHKRPQVQRYEGFISTPFEATHPFETCFTAAVLF